MTELRKNYNTGIVSGESSEVEIMTDDDHDIDGKPAQLTAATLYGRIDADTIKPLRMDASTHSIQTVTYEHHEVHGGDHYMMCDVVDLAINNVRDIQITTPNTTKWTHFIINIDVESETEFYIYENVTISTPGAAFTPINSNRNSGNTSGMTVATIDNTSIANANSDTAVAGATPICHRIIGAGRDSGSLSRSNEIILKQNEDYSLRFIATAAGFINYDLEWYEHTAKD